MFKTEDAYRLLHSSTGLSPTERLDIAHIAQLPASEWTEKDLVRLEQIADKVAKIESGTYAEPEDEEDIEND